MAHWLSDSVRLDDVLDLPPYARLLYRSRKLPSSPKVSGADFVFDFESLRWRRNWFARFSGKTTPETVLELSNCYVNSAGVILSPERQRLWGYEFGLVAKKLEIEEVQFEKALRGSYIFALHPHDAFGHWLLHRLPKILSSVSHGPPSRVLTSTSHWNTDGFFRSAGIEVSKIVYLPRENPKIFFPVEKLIVANHAAPPGTHRILDWKRLTRVRERILENMDLPGVRLGGRNLYLTRTTASHQRRGCENRAFIEDAMASRGYQVLAPETLSFQEQVRMITSAEHVVTEAGSAGLLTMFSKNLKSLTFLSPDPNYEIVSGVAIDAPWARSIALATGARFRYASINGGGNFGSWRADEELVSRVVDNLYSSTDNRFKCLG